MLLVFCGKIHTHRNGISTERALFVLHDLPISEVFKVWIVILFAIFFSLWWRKKYFFSRVSNVWNSLNSKSVFMIIFDFFLPSLNFWFQLQNFIDFYFWIFQLILNISTLFWFIRVKNEIIECEIILNRHINMTNKSYGTIKTPTISIQIWKYDFEYEWRRQNSDEIYFNTFINWNQSKLNS